MGNPIKIIIKSSKKVLSLSKYKNIFVISSLIMVAIIVLLPVYTVPGNDLKSQLRILTPTNYLLLFFLAGSTGLMFSMQMYSNHIKKSLRGSGKGVVGGFSGIMAGIFGTAACSSCVAAIFGFLGFGTVLFLLEYQNYVVSGSIFLIYMSIYLTSKGLDKNWGVCK